MGHEGDRTQAIRMSRPRHLVMMGVSGNGKSTIGTLLAERLGRVFIEGDDFHPEANIAKMSAGMPLDDDDRRPWLETLAGRVRELEAQGQSSVLACSALKRQYRDWLRAGDPDLFFVLLQADYEVLRERMERRTHFMPSSLLRSQFDTLEPLQAGERGIVVDVHMPPEHVVAAIMAALPGTDGQPAAAAGTSGGAQEPASTQGDDA